MGFTICPDEGPLVEQARGYKQARVSPGQTRLTQAERVALDIRRCKSRSGCSVGRNDGELIAGGGAHHLPGGGTWYCRSARGRWDQGPPLDGMRLARAPGE
jgi:hypothetical protein